MAHRSKSLKIISSSLIRMSPNGAMQFLPLLFDSYASHITKILYLNPFGGGSMENYPLKSPCCSSKIKHNLCTVCLITSVNSLNYWWDFQNRKMTGSLGKVTAISRPDRGRIKMKMSTLPLQLGLDEEERNTGPNFW